MLTQEAASPERLAALTLHALAAADREWLLGRLMPAQASHLRALLAELVDLGIPPDPALIDSARRIATQASLNGPNAPPWMNLSPTAFRKLLSEEPLQLVARALSNFDADRQVELLAQWPQPDRAEIQSLCQACVTHPAPALNAAVMNALGDAWRPGRQEGFSP
jgi:hypothetical protein